MFHWKTLCRWQSLCIHGHQLCYDLFVISYKNIVFLLSGLIFAINVEAKSFPACSSHNALLILIFILTYLKKPVKVTEKSLKKYHFLIAL
jgi:hypothetical protein